MTLSRELYSGSRMNMLLKSSCALLSDCISHALDPHGLSYSAYVTLLALHDRPNGVASPSSLAEATAETRSNTTRICDRLTQRGLIRRIGSKSDRRRVDLTLTDAGAALIRLLAPQVARLVEDVYSTFTSDERSSLERLLERLSETLMGTRRQTSPS